jgi:hypothetical protein
MHFVTNRMWITKRALNLKDEAVCLIDLYCSVKILRMGKELKLLLGLLVFHRFYF